MHYIKYKEELLPITIDFSVIKITCAKLKISFSNFEQVVSNPDHLEAVATEALKRGHKLEGKEFNGSAEEVLNESLADFLQIFTECVLKIFTPSGNVKKN